MTDHFCISVTFLDRRFHGRGDGGEPEWPPSPLRLFQSLVAANSDRFDELTSAFGWLENQGPPKVLAPRFQSGQRFRLSVPNNDMDTVAEEWLKGRYYPTKKQDPVDPGTHSAFKTVHPTLMLDGETVHYFWELVGSSALDGETRDRLILAAGRINTLGWGIDTVVGEARIMTSEQKDELNGERWNPSRNITNNMLRIPVPGTFEALRSRHALFLKRVDMGAKHFIPVDPLSRFEMTGYKRPGDLIVRPYIVFHLRDDSGSFVAYPQSRLIHIAGMVRHQVIEVLKSSPPPWIENVEQWLDSYVAGHIRHRGSHRQLSYIPLPSIGHPHADHAVRRILIAAPPGDDQILKHLAIRLNGRQLEPQRGNEFARNSLPTLMKVNSDRVTVRYTEKTNIWASVTPVILPGYNDRKRTKTIKLIEKALEQSGINQPCSYEWREISWFSKSLPAYKFDREKQRIGYVRPDHLLKFPAIHLKIHFDGGMSVPGPLVVGAGRHYGLGLMAAASETGQR